MTGLNGVATSVWRLSVYLSAALVANPSEFVDTGAGEGDPLGFAVGDALGFAVGDGDALAFATPAGGLSSEIAEGGNEPVAGTDEPMSFVEEPPWHPATRMMEARVSARKRVSKMDLRQN